MAGVPTVNAAAGQGCGAHLCLQHISLPLGLHVSCLPVERAGDEADPVTISNFEGERTGLAGVSMRALTGPIKMPGSSSPKAAPSSNPAGDRPDDVPKPQSPQLICQPDDDCWRWSLSRSLKGDHCRSHHAIETSTIAKSAVPPSYTQPVIAESRTPNRHRIKDSGYTKSGQQSLCSSVSE